MNVERWIGFGGIPVLKIEISTPRTKTCPWGPREPGAPSFVLAIPHLMTLPFRGNSLNRFVAARI